MARQTCCSPPFHKFRSLDWWFGNKKNRKRQRRNWNCMSSSRQNYTKHMGGVDVSDQKREYSGVGRSSKKWRIFILHFVLNVCLVNCFILYDLTNHPPYIAHGNRQLTFRRNLVRQRIGSVHSRLASVQAGREVCPSELHSFSILYKKYQAVQKCVLCV